MQRRSPIFIVTSSRPRVGKTLIARALTEYFCAQNRPVAAFDVNPDEFKLIDHLPAYTAAASLNDTRGEMALFDQLVLEDAVPKVVDLSHQLLDRFFSVMQQIDFMAVLKDRFPDLPLVPVLNESVQRVGAYRANFPPTRLGGEPVSIPALSPVVRSVVDRRNFSFVGYVQKTNDKTSELYEWMGRVFISFRELEVRLLLGEITPQLRHSA